MDDQGTTTVPEPAASMPPMPPPPAAAPPAAPTNAFAVASLVLGIVSVVLFWTIWLPLVSGTLAVVFGALGRSKAREDGAPNESMATAGLVLGIVGLVAGVIFLVLFLTVIQERITTQILDIVRNR